MCGQQVVLATGQRSIGDSIASGDLESDVLKVEVIGLVNYVETYDPAVVWSITIMPVR